MAVKHGLSPLCGIFAAAMLIYGLWSIAISFKVLLVAVAVFKDLLRKYPGFYTCVCATLLVSAARSYVRVTEAQAYLGFYWWTEFALVAVGFGVTFEIFRNALRHYPAVRTMASFPVAGTFLFVAGQALIQMATGELREMVGGVMRFQRHMRLLELTLLALLVILIVYYGIPMGRNVWGLLLGYGFYLVSSTLMITVRGFAGPASQNSVETVRQLLGVVTALIWVNTLWRFHPSPVPAPSNALEQDYALAAARTRTVIANARTRIGGLFDL